MSQPALKVIEREGMDKSKALDAALGQIERAFGKGSIMRLGQNENAVESEAISTGSLGLDIALGFGGLPRGRVARSEERRVGKGWSAGRGREWGRRRGVMW